MQIVSRASGVNCKAIICNVTQKISKRYSRMNVSRMKLKGGGGNTKGSWLLIANNSKSDYENFFLEFDFL